jgi:hypothetical protein
MTGWLRSTSAVCVVTMGLLTLVPGARAQTSLAAARDLYSAAAYDDALNAFNKLRTADRREEAGVVEQYRALCLMALGRRSEADAAIEAAVTADPFAQPAENEVSPRVRAAFRDVRRRVLPAVIARLYTDARAAFAAKDPSAVQRFKQVIALIADPDLQSVAGQPPLSEMRTMAADFMVLSTPAAPVAAPPLPARAQLAPARPSTTVAPRDLARIYGAEDVMVVPPIAVRQSFAPMADVFSLRPGTVEIVIDETGTVVAATTRVPVNGVYDRLALATAKSWRYRPAMLDGAAVKYRLVIQLQIPPHHH